MTADLVVWLYRRIPQAARLRLPGGPWPTPTSHLYRPGDGFGRIWQLIGDSKVPRPPMPD
jgi:hypothetical protein